MEDKILYILDGSSLVYRSFYAMNLSTSKGFPTGAVYGFFNTLRRIKKHHNFHYAGICFDVSRKTHRQEKFKEYKIQRPPVPDTLKMQIPIIKELIGYFGISYMEKEGYEADDLIFYLASKAYREGWRVVVVTSDKDMYQLIREDIIRVYNPFRDKFYDYNTFVSEFGFPPDKIVDYLSLAGDSTDNIPGAKGIGKAGALSLVKKIGTVEKIFESLNEVSPKIKTILEKNKQMILLSKELVKLTAPEGFDYNLEELSIKSPDYDNIYRVCQSLELKSLLKGIPQPRLNIKVEIKDGLPLLFKNKLNSLETLVFYKARDWYFFFDEESKVTYKTDFEEAKGILENSEIKKVSYDFKKIYTATGDPGLKSLWFDVQLAAYLLNPSLGDYSLESLCSHFLKIYTRDIPEESYVYFIFRLYLIFKEQIEAYGMSKLFFDVEIPLAGVLADMEKTGIAIDRNSLSALNEEVDEKIKKISKDIFKNAGKTFNLNSPKQLSKVLFEDLRIPPQKKTKTGYSTNEEVLSKLASNYPIAELLLEYRQFSKLKSTYLIPFMHQADNPSSKIYTSFNQTATQTGRLSSSSPNLQNIPIRGDFAQKIRKVFISSFEDGYILSGDYSQVELRVLAHFSKEDVLLDAFRNNKDVHSYTASVLFGASPDSITKAQRSIAKRVNFGIIYGMGSYSLARELNISEREAQSFIDNYFSRYPRVKEFINKTIKEAETKGFVKTITGRIRYLQDINSSNRDLRNFSRRQAINTPVQGTAADIIKIAMIKVFREFKKERLASKLILQVHDELIFDVDKKELKKVVDIVRYNMENSINLIVPLVVNLKIGKNWLELSPLTSNNEI